MIDQAGFLGVENGERTDRTPLSFGTQLSYDVSVAKTLRKKNRARKKRPTRRPAKQRARPMSREAKRLDTCNRILQAAEETFAQQGFAAARTQAIADRANVTKGLIHYHYRTKEELFRSVLDRILFELIKLVQEVTSIEHTRVQRLEIFTCGFFDYLLRHPNFGRLLFSARGHHGRYFDNMVIDHFKPLLKRGVRFLEDGAKDGTFRRVDAQHLLVSIYAITMGYLGDGELVSQLTGQDALSPEGIEARRAALLEMVFCLLGLEPPAHGARRR